MIVVADTSPLLHLARIGRLSLVPAVVGRVVVPRTVWSEATTSREGSGATRAIREAEWLDVVDDPPAQALGLDPGETAAILLALELGADAVLIDERRGRAVATDRGLAVIGTLGIVAGAKRKGLVEFVAPVIEELRADGFWLSDALVVDFLDGIGEGKAST